MRAFLIILWGLVAAFVTGAATIEEDFSGDPTANGWRIFGKTNLFQWDSTNQNLRVTWDSSQTNSFFYHPLGTTLAKDDDFSIAFNLRLNDALGGGFGFQIALGFLNLTNATGTNFVRGTGFNSPNLVEFDYFPEAMFEATVSTIIISSTSQKYSQGGFTFPLVLTPGDLFHVEMSYTSTNRVLKTVMTRNGDPFGPLQDSFLSTNFTDFRTDTVSINSYNGTNSSGSVLAHGTVDNLVVIVPPPPVENLSGSFSNGVWQAQFISRSNWLYTLQRTMDFQSWTNIPPVTSGNATNLFLQDTNSAAEKAFFRVRAERP